jgi:sugar phosphate isomerase/epimerase
MKLSMREYMAPGQTLQERVDNLDKLGYDGIELVGANTEERVADYRKVFAGSRVRPSIVSASGGCLMDPRREERQAAMDGITLALDIAGELGAAGVIVVPLIAVTMERDRPRIPDLSPLAATKQLERDLLIEQLKILGEHAARAGSFVILEPLNRYEQFWLNRLEEGVDLCRAAGGENLKIMADFFHMSIEEADIAASIRAADGYIVNVHLADSNRQTPGRGHTDFRPGLAALKETGYARYMGLECGIPGDRMEELSRVAKHMRELYASV